MNCQTSKRLYKKLPVWIVEDHHDVVRHIYRAVGSRHLPMTNIKMVHLDSHPDLLISVNMPADTVFDKEVLFRVTSTDDYFLSDGLYVPQDQLENPKPLWLSVIQVDPVEHECVQGEVTTEPAAKKPRGQDTGVGEVTGSGNQTSVCNDRLRSPDGSRTSKGDGKNPLSPQTHSAQAEKYEAGSTAKAAAVLCSIIEKDDSFILDIDLDFFSCKNPFKEMYTQEEYSILQGLYSFQRPSENADEEEVLDCVERRVRQLEDLETAFADLVEDDGEESLQRWAANPGMKSIPRLVQSLRSRMESPDYEMVHQAGLTCDYSELPHHISTEEEIQRLVRAVSLVLQALPKPTLVTMSRSSLDEYCPADQVDFIQERVLAVLESLYGSLDIHKEYAAVTQETSGTSS